MPDNDMTCKALKTQVAQLEKGGYSPEKFILHLFDAISNAENADSDEAHFFPNPGETKVYQLGKALIEVIGKNDFQAFLTSIKP